MSCSRNSLKGGYRGILLRTTIGVIKGDTRSLDYGSHGMMSQYNIILIVGAPKMVPLILGNSHMDGY